MYPFLVIGTLLSFLISSVWTAVSFDVYWNSPTFHCKINYGMDLGTLLAGYGVLVNKNEYLQGENITIFYEPQLGFYPKILESGIFENGGIPQRANLSEHLYQAALDIQKYIPNPDFAGLGVIDWESWRPAWDLNWASLSIYQERSKDYAKEMNSSLKDPTLTQVAKKQWEENAKSFMLKTLQLARKLRPQARWGYYLFPDCYNYNGTSRETFECEKTIRIQNDRIDWLWQYSTAIFPSIYLLSSDLSKYSFDERVWKDNGKLKEAFRVASLSEKVYSYVNYFLGSTNMPKEEFERIAAQIAAAGGNGFVIWGSYASINSKERCDQLKDYIVDTIAPVIKNVALKSNICSKKICHGRGKCTWPSDKLITAWKLFKIDSADGFVPEHIVCRCSNLYSGRYCEK